MQKLKLGYEDIIKCQLNREPYLMVDCATEVIPGKSAHGYKVLREDEWFFKVHWPNDPNMPGMLQLQALTQLCALAIFCLPDLNINKVYISSIDKVRFFKKVTPGNNFNMKTKIVSMKRGIADCIGEGFLNEDIACKASFKLIISKLIKQFDKSS